MSKKGQSVNRLPDEDAYIARARQGDKDAYRYIVEGYQDRVYRLVLSVTGKPEAADDLTQEIFIKVFFALESFQGQAAFYTWLFRIASNHCLDYLRRRKLPEVSLDRPIEEESDLNPLNTLKAPAAEMPGTEAERQASVSDLLSELKPDDRMLISLRELEDYSYEDLAEATKCRVNTIKSRLNRAREALRQAFLRKYGNLGNISVEKSVKKGGDKP